MTEKIANIQLLFGLPLCLTKSMLKIDKETPDLVITDFEPALPRAARQAGIPFISLDHQHFLLVSDLSKLPTDLQRHAFFMAQIVKGYCHGQVEEVLPSAIYTGDLLQRTLFPGSTV